jgi:hypothetical protein
MEYSSLAVLATFELSRTRVALYGTTAVPTAVVGAGAATVAVTDESARVRLREAGAAASVQGDALLRGTTRRADDALELAATAPVPGAAAAVPAAAAAASIGVGAVSQRWQLGIPQVQNGPPPSSGLLRLTCLQTQFAHLPFPANLMNGCQFATGIGRK